MGKKVVLILGNGFTIDFLSHVAKKNPDIWQNIDVANLFNHGDSLKWPADSRPGFLSYKNCPNLWNVGARSNLSASDSIDILERVVTSANVYSLKGKKELDEKAGNGFLHAYVELVYYLKYLFIHYNNCIADVEGVLEGWAWADLFRSLSADDEIEEVTVVTYNYDLWLERILKEIGVGFNLPLLTKNGDEKFKIFKPHGSISYRHKIVLPQESFAINYRSFVSDCALSDITIEYDGLEEYTPLNFIIPPAGEPGRAHLNWAQSLRSECLARIRNYGESDVAIICGISYWHVDRPELDSLLISMNDKMEVINVNPSPTSSFDSVLNSLFKNYVHMTRSDFLKGFKI